MPCGGIKCSIVWKKYSGGCGGAKGGCDVGKSPSGAEDWPAVVADVVATVMLVEVESPVVAVGSVVAVVVVAVVGASEVTMGACWEEVVSMLATKVTLEVVGVVAAVGVASSSASSASSPSSASSSSSCSSSAASVLTSISTGASGLL